MRIEDIEIHVGKPEFDYTIIRRLEAKCEATMAFSPAPTVDEMNGKLRSMAAKLGANAIVEVNYDSGVSLTSWKSMKGTGVAVLKLIDDKACPICAERIKRAAVKCRFCGTDIVSDPALLDDEIENHAIEAPSSSSIDEEPMRETNNPQMWLILGGIVLLILMFLGSVRT